MFHETAGPKPTLAGVALTGLAILPAGAAAAERLVSVAKEAYACTSWAAWREYGLASLRPAGASMSEVCPLRLPQGTPVTLVDDDAGEGAAEISYRGKTWFMDGQRLRMR
jgi:hypothetical protein